MSEQTTGIATGDNAALELNHIDIHDNDSGSQGAVVVDSRHSSKKKKKGQQRVADELVAELSDPRNSVSSPDKQQYDEKNIRRRTYDVLNVLMAVDIISKDKKEIQWKGLHSPIEKLKMERLGIRNRIERKASYLQELEEQASLKNLVQRNEQLYRSENPPSGGVSLPFVLVQTDPHATVELEVEISEDNRDMQFVHFDFNSTPFQLYDENYVLKAMEFCDRPQSDIVTLNVTEEGGGSSLSGLHQLQNNTMESNKRCKCGSSLTLSGITNATSSSLHSQVSSKNVFQKPLHVGPGKYVLKRPRSPHRRDENSSMNFNISNNKEIYVECNENGEEYDVPDNNSECNENGEEYDVPDNNSGMS
ncbi:hypothetical protein TSUD_342470 [Trifolium subterraneum]|nr:hypothetical protein TSUD_342470 [Trifolium subterraneum]